MIGQVLRKRYRVLRFLDQGGMSRVYLGMQTDPPREVAVKVLRDELCGQARAREHFKREIHILSQFNHPHAVAYLDCDADARRPYLVMEYLRGTDLVKLLERNKRLSPERAGRLLGQMCAVLHAAHEQGIVHRDFKPGNLMIVHPDLPLELVKLMDFGLAKMTGMLYISPEELVDSGKPTGAGTPEYIAPEQVHGEADRRSDVYSLGCVLYEMLAGRLPFVGDVDHLLSAHLGQLPARFAELGVPGVAPAVEMVVRDCLAKRPEHRPQTAEEVARRYEEALGRKIYQRAEAGASRSSGTLRKVDPAALAAAVVTAADRRAIVSHLTATMPESMALLKLKGFIHDLGGEIVESVPGLIRVRLGDAPRKEAGLRGWFAAQARAEPGRAEPPLTMELLMAKKDPARPGELTITLKLMSPDGVFSAEGRNRCERIGRDLQAYLMGR